MNGGGQRGNSIMDATIASMASKSAWVPGNGPITRNDDPLLECVWLGQSTYIPRSKVLS